MMSFVRFRLKNQRYALFALLLWIQLLSGVGLTLWRHSLVLFSGWMVYPPYVEEAFDDFIALAAENCPVEAVIVYLSPGGNAYTSRFARLHYFLYPHPVEWWSPDIPLRPLDRWQQLNLDTADLEQLIQTQNVTCVMVDELDLPPIYQEKVQFDPMHYLLLVER